MNKLTHAVLIDAGVRFVKHDTSGRLAVSGRTFATQMITTTITVKANDAVINSGARKKQQQ
jgi:hypothetical protein